MNIFYQSSAGQINSRPDALIWVRFAVSYQLSPVSPIGNAAMADIIWWILAGVGYLSDAVNR